VELAAPAITQVIPNCIEFLSGILRWCALEGSGLPTLRYRSSDLIHLGQTIGRERRQNAVHSTRSEVLKIEYGLSEGPGEGLARIIFSHSKPSHQIMAESDSADIDIHSEMVIVSNSNNYRLVISEKYMDIIYAYFKENEY